MATIRLPPDFKEFLQLLNENQVEYLLVPDAPEGQQEGERAQQGSRGPGELAVDGPFMRSRFMGLPRVENPGLRMAVPAGQRSARSDGCAPLCPEDSHS